MSTWARLRLGKRINFRLVNVFSYLTSKITSITRKNYQNHFWLKYHKQKKYFPAYYDLVNSFYILSHFPYSEKIVISIIQLSLSRMHRKRIKPKRLFTLIDQIINNLPLIRDKLHACRVIITGKLKGGTARTSSLNVGFGNLPRQSLTEDIKYEYGDITSKYGSFGVRILT